MDYNYLVSKIFGTAFLTDNVNDFTSCLDEIGRFLDRKLDSFTQDLEEEEVNQIICPSEVVVWDHSESTDNLSNLVRISKDKLSILSQSAFSTLKANATVFGGKYMYEIQLKSKGVMQIGFCSSLCRFTQDTGIGDTKNSYGLDGSKKRLWHVWTRNYGPYWRSGDIFGVVSFLIHFTHAITLIESFFSASIWMQEQSSM